jgi:hypothetical protein
MSDRPLTLDKEKPMSEPVTITEHRVRVLSALERAFPFAAWTIRRTEIRGRAGGAVVLVCVADLYGERRCSEVTVYPRHRSSTWNVTGRSLPKTAHPASIVAATRRALVQTCHLGGVVAGANQFLEGLPW